MPKRPPVASLGKFFKQPHIFHTRLQITKEENIKLAERQAKFIRSLNNALIRIENRTYGICRITGKLIAKERLKLVPHATLSIEAKKAQ